MTSLLLSLFQELWLGGVCKATACRPIITAAVALSKCIASTDTLCAWLSVIKLFREVAWSLTDSVLNGRALPLNHAVNIWCSAFVKPAYRISSSQTSRLPGDSEGEWISYIATVVYAQTPLVRGYIVVITHNAFLVIISAKWTEWNWRIYCFHLCLFVCLCALSLVFSSVKKIHLADICTLWAPSSWLFFWCLSIHDPRAFSVTAWRVGRAWCDTQLSLTDTEKHKVDASIHQLRMSEVRRLMPACNGETNGALMSGI